MFKARDVMVPELRYIDSKEPVIEAAKRIYNEGIGSLIVVAEGEGPIGIVTKRDIIRAILLERLEPSTPIEKVMTSPLVTVDADADLDIVIDLMFKYNISHLPVREGNKIIGMISDYDIMEVTRDLIDIVRGKQLE